MTHIKIRPYLFSILFSLILMTPISPWAQETVDNGIWEKLLIKNVDDGIVDYQGLQHQEQLLDSYLEILAAAGPDRMEDHERMAFYINLYNAWTVKLILGKYPNLKSIKDLGTLFSSPWKKKIVRVNNSVISLDDVEHGILRQQFKDPRIHFAINCASKSCPPLRREPYSGAILDAQLDDAAAAFVNDTRHNRIKGDVLQVSKIFKWFKSDFEGEIIEFFQKYATADLKQALMEKKGSLTVAYLDYDWSLNDGR